MNEVGYHFDTVLVREVPDGFSALADDEADLRRRNHEFDRRASAHHAETGLRSHASHHSASASHAHVSVLSFRVDDLVDERFSATVERR